MSEIVKIIGGKTLSGEVTPVPNKNAILAVIPACLLTDETVIYKDIPNTTDVTKMLAILKDLGATVDDTDYSHIKINCSTVNKFEINAELGNVMRASILFAGPLLVRFGKARIPLPGGCVLGKRSISSHLDVFQKVGIKAVFEEGYVNFTAPTFATTNKSYDVWQMEASVTASENLFLYAAGTEATFTVTDAACEPHVTQLLELLSQMGAKVAGIESNRVTITGSKKLKGATFAPDPDFVDIGGLIVAAAVTKSIITIKGVNIPNVVNGLVQTFEKFGIKIKRSKKDLIVNGTGELYIDSVNSGFPAAGTNLPKLCPRPWPGFPVDVLPVMVTLACKTKGKTLIQNWMYETGLDFVNELDAMGANIFVADPQRIIVEGPVTFKGGNVFAPSIIQAAKALFLAALADPVQTNITGLEILKRRYPNVIETYKGLGADLSVVEK